MPTVNAIGHQHLYSVTFSDGDPKLGDFVQRFSLPVIGYVDDQHTARLGSWVSDPFVSKQVPIQFLVDEEGLLLPFLSKHCWSVQGGSDLEMVVDLLRPDGTTHCRVRLEGVSFANMCVSELYNQQSDILTVNGSVRFTSVHFGGSST